MRRALETTRDGAPHGKQFVGITDLGILSTLGQKVICFCCAAYFDRFAITKGSPLEVMGMYPGDPGNPGGDCAGTVCSVGADAASLRPGNDVFGIAWGCLQSYACTEALLPLDMGSGPILYLLFHMGIAGRQVS